MSIENINNWFKQAMPKPTKDQQRIQFGVHAEEYGEGLACIGDANEQYKMLVQGANAINTQLATTLKKNTDFNLVITDRKELLDGLCDVIVTAVGVAHSQGFDILGALKEVSNSNDSKFVDGKAIFNEFGKIAKGPQFFRPNLDPFLGSDPAA